MRKYSLFIVLILLQIFSPTYLRGQSVTKIPFYVFLNIVTKFPKLSEQKVKDELIKKYNFKECPPDIVSNYNNETSYYLCIKHESELFDLEEIRFRGGINDKQQIVSSLGYKMIDNDGLQTADYELYLKQNFEMTYSDSNTAYYEGLYNGVMLRIFIDRYSFLTNIFISNSNHF